MTTDKALFRPSVYQFKLGEFIVTNILEGFAHRDDMHPFVATNASSNDVKQLADQYRLPFPKMEHNFVVTLIQTADKLIAFDPGFGENAPMPTAGWFAKGLALAGYTLDDINMVVLSHCHPDHIGNLMTGGAATFANAEIVFGRREFDYWSQSESVSEMRKPTQALFRKVAAPLADKARFIEPGDSIVTGITAIEAFGHSAGHLCFHIESNSQQLLMLNDAVPHYVASFAQPDWHFVMDDDPAAAATTRKRMLEMAYTEALPVIGFHIPFPALGYVDKHANGYEFRPATYQFNLASS